ncbi:MAG: beta-glucosidase [Bacteroidetes bacterium]|nr:MAG: beta-glucosidase [Bacteroidota bacterium]
MQAAFRKKLIILLWTFTVPVILTAQVNANPKKARNQEQVSTKISKPLSDSALVELVEKQTLRYFWEFGHPVSGLARESGGPGSEHDKDIVTTGGSGFGIMAIIVGSERKWIPRDSALARIRKIVNFLSKANSYHGIFPHWMNGTTGVTIPFSRKDDGADIVETSYLFQGLLCARQYFNQNTPKENELRDRINWLWEGAEWNWHTRGGLDLLYWHWSPNNGWSMNFEIRGWNECLITYVLAASSPTYPISPNVYHNCWAVSNHFINGGEYYGIRLPLGFAYGGPLFFSHYSFLGLDPHGLKDQYADYWEQNYNHTLINFKHCVINPHHFKGYGENCWGLTASLTYDGYDAHSPTNDRGTISPTAALSAFPFAPNNSMNALRHFYNELGNRIWEDYGFTDAFNETKNWFADAYLAIDQGPQIVMIENYRSGLLWKLFMSCPEVINGLKRLGFQSPYIK